VIDLFKLKLSFKIPRQF